MPKCNFCKKEFERGTGKLLIQKSGKMLWFCSSKCEKSAIKLKRNPKKLTWIRKRK